VITTQLSSNIIYKDEERLVNMPFKIKVPVKNIIINDDLNLNGYNLIANTAKLTGLATDDSLLNMALVDANGTLYKGARTLKKIQNVSVTGTNEITVTIPAEAIDKPLLILFGSSGLDFDPQEDVFVTIAINELRGYAYWTLKRYIYDMVSEAATETLDYGKNATGSEAQLFAIGGHGVAFAKIWIRLRELSPTGNDRGKIAMADAIMFCHGTCRVMRSSSVVFWDDFTVLSSATLTFRTTSGNFEKAQVTIYELL